MIDVYDDHCCSCNIHTLDTMCQKGTFFFSDKCSLQQCCTSTNQSPVNILFRMNLCFSAFQLYFSLRWNLSVNCVLRITGLCDVVQNVYFGVFMSNVTLLNIMRPKLQLMKKTCLYIICVIFNKWSVSESYIYS